MMSLPDLDELVARVRTEAERPEYQLREFHEGGAPAGARVVTVAAGGAEPAQVLRSPVRDVDDLLLIANRERFIASAYQAILQRPVDSAGLQHFEARLRQGYGQPFVLAALRSSSEGRAVNAALPGFGVALTLHRFWQLCTRVRCGVVGKLANRAYHAWRHLKLALSGRLLTALSARDERVLAVQAERMGTVHEALLVAQADGQRIHEQFERSLSELKTVQAEGGQRDRAIAELNQTMLELDRAMQDRLSKVTSELTTLNLDTSVLRASMKTLRLNMEHGETVAMGTVSVTPAAPAAEDAALAARIGRYYLAFEEAHRGSESAIRAHQQRYLAALASLPEALLELPVLDLGCGRGEWLQLLGEHGFHGRGVDSNAMMVARGRSQGLEVEEADVLAVLQQLPTASVAAVSAFHLIEHLPFEVLFAMLEQVARVLAPGGLIMLETPNPENVLVGSHTFYHDFSHRNPVTPVAAEFLLAYLGFEERELWRLNPYPPGSWVDEHSAVAERVNGHFCGPQDFALIARVPLNEGDGAEAR